MVLLAGAFAGRCRVAAGMRRSVTLDRAAIDKRLRAARERETAVRRRKSGKLAGQRR
jgi:uncharacterized membrane protein